MTPGPEARGEDGADSRRWVFATSKNQIRRLGERLAAGSMTEADELGLQAYEEFCYSQLTTVVSRLRDAGFHPTDRPKNRGTTAEKIRRERSAMTRIHDLVGCRIVLSEDDGRVEQYRAVKRIEAALDDLAPERVDRILAPSHGYRAVHVIVWSAGIPIEIQVRTYVQHQWAEIVEKLADALGRGIRYGDAPDYSQAHPDDREKAEQLYVLAQELPGLIDQYEYLLEDHLLGPDADDDFDEVRVELKSRLEQLRQALQAIHELASTIR